MLVKDPLSCFSTIAVLYSGLPDSPHPGIWVLGCFVAKGQSSVNRQGATTELHLEHLFSVWLFFKLLPLCEMTFYCIIAFSSD